MNLNSTKYCVITWGTCFVLFCLFLYYHFYRCLKHEFETWVYIVGTLILIIVLWNLLDKTQFFIIFFRAYNKVFVQLINNFELLCSNYLEMSSTWMSAFRTSIFLWVMSKYLDLLFKHDAPKNLASVCPMTLVGTIRARGPAKAGSQEPEVA